MPPTPQTYPRPRWSRFSPQTNGKSIILTAFISGALGVPEIALCTTVAQDYGVTLFLASPCALGVAAPLLHGIGAPRSFLQCFAAATAAQAALFAGILFFALEGIICIIMAAPLWLTLAVFGTCIAYPIHKLLWKNHLAAGGFPVTLLLFLFLLPTLIGAQHVAQPSAPTLTLTTSIDIAAPPEIVWQNLVQFPEISARPALCFRLGIACPESATLTGSGPGAIRACIFSTGPARETVTLFNQPRLLEFTVLSTPPAMRETSIYPNLHPAHLVGYLTSERARFQLIALPNHKTRLIGTSWYKNRLAPLAYWKLWSDPILHQIHLRVFNHIKCLSESQYQFQLAIPQSRPPETSSP